MKNRLNIVIVLLFISNFVFSQINTNSPYSAFGIGDIAKPGFSRNHAMGGISQGIRSPNHINYLNPASYSAQDSMSFIFNFGITSNMTEFKTSELKTNSSNTNIHHFALAFPIKRWWNSSFGLMPYSNLGYNVEDLDFVGNDTINKLKQGSGNINQLYFGNSFQINEKLSVGFNACYLWGFIQKTEIITLATVTNASIIETQNKMSVGSWALKLGMQYTNRYKDNFDYTLGVTLGNKTNIDSNNELFLINHVYNTQDTVFESIEKKGHFVLPLSLGIGFTINKDNKLIVGADYNMQKWSSSSKLDSLTNSNSINIGMEYTPDRYAGGKFLNRISYRIGTKYEKTYLYLNGTQIKNYSVSFGLGIPVKKSKTSLNFAFETGRRGTIANGLIQENYNVFTLSLSLYDYWFVKRKFD